MKSEYIRAIQKSEKVIDLLDQLIDIFSGDANNTQQSKKTTKKITKKVIKNHDPSVKHECCGSKGPRHKGDCPKKNLEQKEKPKGRGSLYRCKGCKFEFKSTLPVHICICPNCSEANIEKT